MTDQGSGPDEKPKPERPRSAVAEAIIPFWIAVDELRDATILLRPVVQAAQGLASLRVLDAMRELLGYGELELSVTKAELDDSILALQRLLVRDFAKAAKLPAEEMLSAEGTRTRLSINVEARYLGPLGDPFSPLAAARERQRHSQVLPDFLRRSAIVSLVQLFELHLWRVLEEYLMRVPRTNGSDVDQQDNASGDPTIRIPFSQFQSAHSIEGLRRIGVRSIIANDLKGGCDNWQKTINKRTKVDIKACSTLPWSDFVERFERRNMIIHENGQVSASYISVMSKLMNDDQLPALGAHLAVDESYVSDSFDMVIVRSIVIADQILARFDRKQIPCNIRLELLSRLVAHYVARRYWKVVMYLAEYVISQMEKSHRCADANPAQCILCVPSTLQVLCVNYCLSLKRLRRRDQFMSSMHLLDGYIDDPAILLATHALRDDVAAFFDNLPRVAAALSGKRRYRLGKGLREFEVFREMRKQPDFARRVAEFLPARLGDDPQVQSESGDISRAEASQLTTRSSVLDLGLEVTGGSVE